MDMRINAARKFATLFTQQWFPGKENIVADALSRDNDRLDEQLTHILHSFAPLQTPSNFKIAPLLSEISSWLILLLSKLPVKEQFWEQHKRTKLGRGGNGLNIANQSACATLTSMDSTDISESNSWVHSPWHCAKDDSPEATVHWLREQSAVPSHMWFRPSGKMDVRTQQKTRIWSLDGFYTDCTMHSKTKTQN